MATPWRHPDSGIYWLRRRIPADLIAIVGKKEEKVSLRTRDPAEAKAAYIRAAAEVEARWANLRKGTQRISHKEAVAIAGEFYHQLVAAHEDDPGDPALVLGRLLADQVAAGSPEVKVIAAGNPETTGRLMARLMNQHRPSVQDYLRNRGEVVDDESFERIMTAVNAAIAQGRERVLRYAEGDYRPDPNSERFPQRAAPHQATADRPADFYDLKAVYEKFADEARHAPSTRKKWSAVIAEVAGEHSDVRQISDMWCVEWKDRLLARGLSARSVQYGYLAALRSTLAWAVANKRIDKNPLTGIGVKVGKQKRTRGKGYTDAEAALVLSFTLKPITEQISKEHRAARRWLPWLAAYSGARIGELAQLRGQDVQEREGVWLMWITPEAGSTKDGNARWVAVHPDLIAQGFLEFARANGPGPLFYNTNRHRGGSTANPIYKKVTERLAAWIRREGMTDKEIAPSHAWRHRFKTLARRYDLDAGARDYMQGHSPASEGEGYGEFEPVVLLREISKLPAYRFGNGGS